MIQEIAASRGDTDLVVVQLSVENRFRVKLAAATVQMSLLGSSGVITWHPPDIDTLLNPNTREVSLWVGPAGLVLPAGSYVPLVQLAIAPLNISIRSGADTVSIK